MNKYRWLNAVLWLSFLLFWGCATPSSPTGGPPDKEGPKIVETEPKTGTTNFSGRSITLHFSEFVSRSSLRPAIVVEPDIGINYKLDWGRKSASLVFEDDIPDLTTLIITVGTDFKDMNSNKMAEPYKVAVSTGPEIDKGKLFGRVINAKTGKGDEGQRILLYRVPVDLSERANYIASTDTSGKFQFDYLRQGKYKAFWVDDRNRNKIWDQQQERAQPFNQEFVQLAKAEGDSLGAVDSTRIDSTGIDSIGTDSTKAVVSDSLGVVYYTAVDTTAPRLDGVGLFSSRRLRMRFSENIELSDSVKINITDTTGTLQGGAYPLYIEPDQPFVLFAHSEDALNPDSSYSIDLKGITDQSGNPVEKFTQAFTGSAQEDTTQQRIVKRNNLSGYYPTDPIEVTYAGPIQDPVIRDSLRIVEGDSLIKKWPNVETKRNVLRILPRDTWKGGTQYEVRVWDPIIGDYRKFQPKIWHDSQMGTLHAMLKDSTIKNVRLRVENGESEVYRDTVFTGEVEIANLPPLNYKVTAYQDLNSNGKWDFGQVSPFVKPEPYFIQTQVPVKEGLTGDLTIVFPN